MDQLRKLADDNARAGVVVVDTQSEALRRWREDHGLAEEMPDETGLNRQEAERR
jgi:hypothetical protein